MGRAATEGRPRKRRRRHSAAAADKGVDSFSTLPDDVLLLIASRLSVRAAVSLSALSRRFRHLLSRFDRVDSLSLSVSEPVFPSPVRDSRPCLLRRLCLALPPKTRLSPTAARRVLKAAADRGVSELSIRLHRHARLPRNVLSIRSLTVLSLHNGDVPRWSLVACACLHTLKLYRVAIRQDTLAAVLAAAPLLETLHLLYCTVLHRGCTLESSAVRNLRFKPPLEQLEITLRTPGLRNVTLYTRPKTIRAHLEPAPGIRKAYLHISKPRKELQFSIRPFLDAGKGLACLTLRGIATKLLSSDYKELPKLAVTFEHMSILSVSLDLSRESEPAFLLKLLESCPSLKHLTISALIEGKENGTPPSFADHEDRLTKLPCLSKSLLQFNFVRFNPQQYQKQLLILVLSQAKKLKKMSVEFPKKQEVAVREILSVKKAPVERKSTKYGQCHLQLEYP